MADSALKYSIGPIETDVPVRQHRFGPLALSLLELKPGESREISGVTAQHLSVTVIQVRRKFGGQFTTRLEPNGSRRVWRIK